MTDTTPRVHISLRSRDLAATTAFYTQLFGEGPDKVRDGYVRFMPTGTPILLSVMEGEPGVDHFGLRMAASSGATAAWARIEESGIELSPSEDVVCCHAAKNEAWLADPDGRSWEVYAVTDEAPERAASGGCCT